MIDYLKYKELVSNSEASFEKVDDLIKLIKLDIGEKFLERKVFN